MIFRTTLWLPLLLLFSTLASAVEFPEKPPGEDFFVDKAQLIDAAQREAINATAKALLDEEQIPLFVVTISSLSSYEASGYSIEQYAQALFDHWGIGSPERNYGILLLVSRGDRKARIELGAGWAGQHDREAADIMGSLIVPAFTRGDFSIGIADGVRGLDALARGLQLPEPTTPWWLWPALIGVVIFLGLVIRNLFKSGRSGWAWALIALIGAVLAVFFFLVRAAGSGSGGGSSSGGFGGGSSGGGGATGSW